MDSSEFFMKEQGARWLELEKTADRGNFYSFLLEIYRDLLLAHIRAAYQV